MNDSKHKTRIARRFATAAATYDVASHAQQQAAQRLAELVMRRPVTGQPPRILEIGCGSGHLTEALKPHLPGEWFVSDIAPAMVDRCRRRCAPDAHYFVMDGEVPSLTGPFDLIVSNLAAQWFVDLPKSLAGLAELLAPGGLLALSTLGEQNFAEWRAAHEAVELSAATMAYPATASLLAALPEALILDQVAEQHLPAHHGGPLDFLHSLRAIGADTPRPGSRPLTAGQLRRILRHLARHAPQGVHYHVVHLLTRRRI